MNTTGTKKWTLLKYIGITIASVWFFCILLQWLTIPQYNLINLQWGFSLLTHPVLPGKYFFTNFFFSLKQLVSAAFIIISSYGYGRFILLSFFRKEYSSFEIWLFSSCLGLAFFGHLVLITIFCHFLYSGVVVALLLPGIATGILSLKYKIPVFSFSNLKKVKLYFSPAEKIFSAIVIFFLLLSLTITFSPDTGFDPLNYTLAIPNWWIINHGIKDMPQHIYHNLFSFYASIYTAAMSIGNEITAKILNNYAVLVSIAGIVIWIGNKLFNRQTIILSLAIICASYNFYILSSITESDSISIMFSFIALIMILRDGGKSSRYVIIPAVFTGCAMASKAITVIFAACLSALLLYLNKDNMKEGVKKTIIFILVASLPVIPWLIKNQIYRGNPFFPFFSNIFGFDKTYDPELINLFFKYSNAFNCDFISIIKNLYNLHIAYYTPFNNHTQPLLMASAGFIPFIYKKTDWKQNLLLIFTLILLTVQLLFLSSTRYFFNVYVLLTMFFSYYIYPYIEKKRLLLTFFTAIILFFSLSILGEVKLINMLAIPYGNMDYDSYLSHYVPYGYYKAVKWANDNLPDSSKILINDWLGRSFYIKRNYYVTSYVDKYWYDIFAKNAKNADDIYIALKENGFTHIIENKEKIFFSYNHINLKRKETSIDRKNMLHDFYQEYTRRMFPTFYLPGEHVTYIYEIK